MKAPRSFLIPKRSKYGNRKTEVDGLIFDSAREAKRWSELRLLERAGRIADLKRQVRYALDVNGQPICHYVADFVYRADGQPVVEDAKGFRTDVYKLKAKLMKAVHSITVVEV